MLNRSYKFTLQMYSEGSRLFYRRNRIMIIHLFLLIFLTPVFQLFKRKDVSSHTNDVFSRSELGMHQIRKEITLHSRKSCTFCSRNKPVKLMQPARSSVLMSQDRKPERKVQSLRFVSSFTILQKNSHGENYLERQNNLRRFQCLSNCASDSPHSARVHFHKPCGGY